MRATIAPPAKFRPRATFVVALLALGIWVACFRFPMVWIATGIGEPGTPFLDLYGLLASSDAAQAGANPFQPNALDPYHRPFLYSEWWLAAGKVGLTRADTGWIGWLWVGTTLVTALAMCRPRTLRENIWMFLWFVSPAMLMAINRANPDLLMYVMVSAGLVALRSARWPWRALGMVLLAAAAVLKYFPGVALIVLLDARTRRELFGALMVYGLVLVLAWLPLEAGLASAARFKPVSTWLYAFGAPVIFRDFGVENSTGWLALTAIVGVAAVWWAWRSMPSADESEASRVDAREFAVGAAMVVACFFLGASYAYKLVFSAWLLPVLWRGEHDWADERWRRATGWLLAGTLAFEGVMAVVLNVVVTPLSRPLAEGLLTASLVVAQLFGWGLVLCLLRFLLVYAGLRLRSARFAR